MIKKLKIQKVSRVIIVKERKLVASFNQATASLQPYQCWFFWIKPIARLIFKAQNIPEGSFHAKSTKKVLTPSDFHEIWHRCVVH